MIDSIPSILGQVISIAKGKKHEISTSPTGTSKRLIGIDDLRNNDLIRYTDDKSGVEATFDDLLIAWDGANAGTIGFGKSGYIGSTIARLRVTKEIPIFTPFLGLYLKSQFEYLRRTATGATIPHINRKALESIPLPFVDYESQIRIAHLLGKVEGLIASRKQHLQQFDSMLQSIFLEMFGPNSQGYEAWPLVEIRDLAKKHKGAMRTGPFGSNLLHSEFTDEGDVAVLGIDNAVQNHFTWGQRRFISSEKYKGLENYRVYPGDVIVTIMGTIGRSAVVPVDIPLAINTKHLAAISLNKKLANPLFLSYSIHSSPFILNQFKSKNRGAIMNGLNLGLIKETKIKRPPISLQNRFAELHARIDQLKAKYQQSLSDLEALYGALSQQAFKGEVNLSRVPSIGLQPEAAKAVTTEPLFGQAKQGLTINLPYFENLPDGPENSEARKVLIARCLDAYNGQLGSTPFSVQQFMAATQTRMGELHPDTDFEIGINDYEQIKTWVFKALATGTLKQAFDDAGNRIQLQAGMA